MAQVIVCDGCGGAGSNCVKVGHVIRRDYCEACKVRADDYQAEIDALHSRLAEAWRDGLAEIRRTHGSALHSLPDVAT